MRVSAAEIERLAHRVLAANGGETEYAPRACAFLQQVDYPGLQLLAEAVESKIEPIELKKDALGVDLHNQSCVFIGADVGHLLQQHGRLFLRNVRHGLYLLPASVWGGYGIGCPVDPSFALGGTRHKNPYTEKLALAEQNGIEVDETLWKRLAA